jgi:AraC-like DNA-binding protein
MSAMNDPVRSLVSRTDIGMTANVVQQSSLRISRLAVDSPALILLLHGEKTLSSGPRQWHVREGDVVVIAGGQCLDVENRLSSDGLFEARWVMWEDGLFPQVAHLHQSRRGLSDVAVLQQVPPELVSTIDRAVAVIKQPSIVPAQVAAHRMIELLLWLSEHGVTLSGKQPASTASRLRQLIVSAPGELWTTAGAADRMATSETTLRRKLVKEGTSFNAVLADTRLSLAMTLLQSTDRSVAVIAANVGYESASRFAIRFRQRFGFAPSVVRGHKR